MTLLTACGSSVTDRALSREAADSALCAELEEPINKAVNTTLEFADSTPPQVINSWTSVVEGYDAGCKNT